MFWRKLLRNAVLAGCIGCILSIAGGASAAGWQPARNVEIVVPAAAGSALDGMARILQRVLQAQKALGTNMSVLNKAGGANAVGFAYLSQQADGHSVLITPFTIITNRLTGVNALYHTDFTPLAMLADEHIVFVVHSNSTLRTGRDLLDRLRKDPTSVSMALASALGNANHIAVSLVGKAAGVDPKRFKIAVFNSGGESATAVMGGHIDLAMASTALVASQISAGRLRAIAVASARRLTGPLAATPTWREQGIDVVFSSWRALIGPRGMTAEQIAYWDGVLPKIAASEEWKNELAQQYLDPSYMGSDDTRKFFQAQSEQLRGILQELGLAK